MIDAAGGQEGGRLGRASGARTLTPTLSHIDDAEEPKK